MNTADILERAFPVMPVLTVERLDQAVPLAEALAAGGMQVIEITLRTPAALDAIAAIRAAVPTLTVGAGTVLTAKAMGNVVHAGAHFAVSPGFTTSLAAAAHECGLPYLPGVITPSEVQRALEFDLDRLKFFPAEAAGGTAMLRGYHSVYPDVRFCPTGGIREGDVGRYLALPNVSCIGGSWIAPAQLVAAGDWPAITRLAAGAVEAGNGAV